MFMRKFCAFLSSVSRGDRGEMVPRTPRAPFHIEAELPRADQDVSVLPPPPARSDEKGFFSINQRRVNRRISSVACEVSGSPKP